MDVAGENRARERAVSVSVPRASAGVSLALHARLALFADAVAQRLQRVVGSHRQARIRGGGRAVVDHAYHRAHVAARRDRTRAGERDRIARREKARLRAHGEGVIERPRAGRPLQRRGDRQRGPIDRGRDDVGIDGSLDLRTRFDALEVERAGFIGFADHAAVEGARSGGVLQAGRQRDACPHVGGGAGAGVGRNECDPHPQAGLDVARRVDQQRRRRPVEARHRKHRELGPVELELRDFGRGDGAGGEQARIVFERRLDLGTIFEYQRRAGRQRRRDDRRAAEPERIVAVIFEDEFAAVDADRAGHELRAVRDRQHDDDVARGGLARVVDARGDADIFAGFGRADRFDRDDRRGILQDRRRLRHEAHDVGADDAGLVREQCRLQVDRRAVVDRRVDEVADRDPALDAGRDFADVGARGREQRGFAAHFVERLIVDAPAAGQIAQPVGQRESHAQTRCGGAALIVKRERRANDRPRFDDSVR